MPAVVDPGKVKCTFAACDLHFATEKDMKRHKKHDDDHDYCHKCDEDFESYDDLAYHKIYRPDMHNKACRVCGEEFKSDSGLKRHIELVRTRHPSRRANANNDRPTRSIRSLPASAATSPSIGPAFSLSTSNLATATSSPPRNFKHISCTST